jgi:hypothetical protein
LTLLGIVKLPTFRRDLLPPPSLSTATRSVVNFGFVPCPNGKVTNIS